MSCSVIRPRSNVPSKAAARAWYWACAATCVDVRFNGGCSLRSSRAPCVSARTSRSLPARSSTTATGTLYARSFRRWRRIEVVKPVLTSIGDQSFRGSFDVVRQSLDGAVGVAGQGQILQLAMFGGQVALTIVGQCPPPPVQLGTVTQSQDNTLQASIVTALGEAPMKVMVDGRPWLMEPSVRVDYRCALQEVMGGNDLRLPQHIPALDRQAQRHRFNLHTRFREADDVFDGKLTHPKATLRFGNDQALRGQPGQCFTNHRLAHREAASELHHSQLLTGAEHAVEQLGAQHIINLCAARHRRVDHPTQHS